MTTETETRTGIYEAMFLASQSAAADFNGLIEHISHLFERCHGTVVAMKKWDERRLAYEIDKQKRGVYILAYFTCSTDQIAQLERDAQISDQIMRLLVTTADHLTDEEIAACDDRQGLSDEAKLKAEQGAQEDVKSTGARLGAPEQAQQAEMNKTQEAKPAPAPEASDEGDDEPKADENAQG